MFNAYNGGRRSLKKPTDGDSNISSTGNRVGIVISKFSGQDLIDIIELSKLEFSKTITSDTHDDWKARYVDSQPNKLASHY